MLRGTIIYFYKLATSRTVTISNLNKKVYEKIEAWRSRLSFPVKADTGKAQDGTG